jgi:hypothetical protein
VVYESDQDSTGTMMASIKSVFMGSVTTGTSSSDSLATLKLPEEPAPFGMSWREFLREPLTGEQVASLPARLIQKKHDYYVRHPNCRSVYEAIRSYEKFEYMVGAFGLPMAREQQERQDTMAGLENRAADPNARLVSSDSDSDV